MKKSALKRQIDLFSRNLEDSLTREKLLEEHIDRLVETIGLLTKDSNEDNLNCGRCGAGSVGACNCPDVSPRGGDVGKFPFWPF